MEMLSSLSQAQAILQDKLLPEDKDEAEDGSEVPDDDAIKMFVGQVPRSMDEDALKDFFEDFGRVYQVSCDWSTDWNTHLWLVRAAAERAARQEQRREPRLLLRHLLQEEARAGRPERAPQRQDDAGGESE